MISNISLFAAEGAINVGSKGDAATVLPASFHAAQESEDTLFIMPRKDDENGPISMRLTALRDLRDQKLDDKTIRALLMRLNNSQEVKKAGAGNKPGSVDGNHSSGTAVADCL